MLEKLEQLGKINKNEPLKNYTTFKIGGPAKYFYIAKTTADLIKAVKLAEKLNLEYFILGGGSNILISDNGFDGLVIKTRNEEFEINDNNIVTCGAGLTIGRLLGLVNKHGLAGLEFMASIPGTVGGAACGNAGAYGQGFGNLIQEVEVYKNGQVITLKQKEMQYEYRDSIIKKQGGVILKVKTKLKKGDAQKSYQRILSIIKERIKKLPLDKPSAGSVFKNIELNEISDLPKLLKGLDITEKEFKQAAKYKLPVGYIIEKLDLKGKTIGRAQVSEKHGNIIVNLGGARAEHVIMLISDIKMRVRTQVGIQLMEEIKYIGF